MQSKSIQQSIPKLVEIGEPIRTLPTISEVGDLGYGIKASVNYDLEYILRNKEFSHRVGYFTVTKLEEGEDTWELNSIGTINGHINRNSQGIKGLGEVILKEALQYIRIFGGKRVILISRAPAIPFYIKVLLRLKEERIINDFRVYNEYFFKIEL